MHRVILLILLSALFSCSQAPNDNPESASPQKIEPQFEWKLVTAWPKNFPGLGTAPEKFASIVNEMSRGRLTINVYGANEIVPAFEVFDAVSSGTVEMGHSAAYYWKGKIPAAQFFAAIPFGFTAQEMNAWLYYGGGLALWREIYAPHHVRPFPGGNTGVQMAGWYNKDINSIGDLKGLKVRMPGLGAEVISAAGATAVNLPGSELFTALQTGAIDATEWVGPYNDLAFGLFDAASRYYYPGWHEPGTALEFIVHEPSFQALPKDLQKIVEIACQAINQDMLSEYTARNATALHEIQLKPIDIKALPDSVLDHLRVHATHVVETLGNQSPKTEKIYHSYRAFRDRVFSYHRITEKHYLNHREPKNSID